MGGHYFQTSGQLQWGDRSVLVQRGLASEDSERRPRGSKLRKSQRSRALQKWDRLACMVVSSPPLEVSKYLFIHLLSQYRHVLRCSNNLSARQARFLLSGSLYFSEEDNTNKNKKPKYIFRRESF